MHGRLTTLLGAAVIVALPLTAVAKTELRLINGFDQRQSSTRLMLNPFMADVKKASKGELTIRASGPEVIKPFEQMQPTSRGVFDMMFTTAVYHSGATSLGIAFYAMAPDPAGFRENGLYDAFDKDYQRFNLKLLSIIYGEGPNTGAYQAVLKKPLAARGDLVGRKLRGTKTYEPFVKALGGSIVLMPGGEVYTALEKGVVDGAMWPISGALDFKWYEVAPVMARPTFGHSSYTLTINMDSFKKLSAANRELLVEHGRLLEYLGMVRADIRVGRDIAKLRSLGMKETHYDAKKFSDTMSSYWKGLWDLAEAHKPSTKHVKAMRELARKTGALK